MDMAVTRERMEIESRIQRFGTGPLLRLDVGALWREEGHPCSRSTAQPNNSKWSASSACPLTFHLLRLPTATRSLSCPQQIASCTQAACHVQSGNSSNSSLTRCKPFSRVSSTDSIMHPIWDALHILDRYAEKGIQALPPPTLGG